MKLVIAEKPELAKAIAAALPGGLIRHNGYMEKGEFVVTWAFGHLFRLKEPQQYDSKYKKWTLEDLPVYFDDWDITPDGNKKEQINIIESLLKKADMVIHAGDPDDEGQLLISEILDYFKYSGTTKRLLVNDNNPDYIAKALEKMQDNEKFVPIGLSAYARSVADYMVGINYSRYFSLLNRATLSVGRVQTPTLGMVVNRDYLIDNHIKECFYELFAQVDIDFQSVQAKFIPSKNNQNLEDGKIKDEVYLQSVLQTLLGQKSKGVVTQKEVLEAAPLPFNLVKLQSYASARFGYSPEETLSITQSLRERHQAITYNRSDCQYLNEEHFVDAPKLITAILGNLAMEVEQINTSQKSKCFNSKNVTAHHAIIPTHKKLDITKLSTPERNLYLAICKYYLIQFLPPVKKNRTELTIDLSGGDMLRAVSVKVLELGYLGFLQEKSEEDLEDEQERFVLAAGEYVVAITDGEVVGRETKPPKRYTKATLNEDMTRIAKYVTDPEIKELLKRKDKDKKGENGSIGTSSTRSKIIEVLCKRGFLEEKGNTILSTTLAKNFYGSLPQEVKTPDMTAKWWVIQEDIKEGNATPQTLFDMVLGDIKVLLSKEHTKIQNSVAMARGDREVIGICPRCGKAVYENKASFYCAAYGDEPKCTFSMWKNNKFFELRGKELTKTAAKKFLKGQKVFYKGFKSQSGKPYDGYVAMKDTGTYVNFEMSYENEDAPL